MYFIIIFIYLNTIYSFIMKSPIMKFNKNIVNNDMSNNYNEYDNHNKAKHVNIQKLESLKLKFTPKTPNQKHYFNILENRKKKIVVVNGPAGCGKTLFACIQGIILLEKNAINKIVLTRPTVLIEKEDFGFLPGTLEQKMDPWLKPFFDIFLTYYTQKQIDALIYNQKIEICPITYMRGRTFHNTFIISDEMQNSSPHQMKTIATRIGSNSKLVILGDTQQNDIDTTKTNIDGLQDFLYRIKQQPCKLISYIKLNNNDIERSIITKEVLKLYSNYDINDTPNSFSPINKQLLGKDNRIHLQKQLPINVYNISSNNNKMKKIPKFTSDCAIIPLNQISKHYPL